jgi:von Willebrand factor type A domain
MTLWLLGALLIQAPVRSTRAVDVVMMVDVSHSVTFGVIKRDRRLMPELGEALAEALESGDTARIGTAGDAIVLDTVPLRDGAAIRAKADALGTHIGGASPIWDALVTAASALPDSSGRRGIILVTDGRSTGNKIGFADMLERVKASGIPVFVVSIDKSDKLEPDPGARLLALAKATGGTCLFVERPALRGAIMRAVHTLRAHNAP